MRLPSRPVAFARLGMLKLQARIIGTPRPQKLEVFEYQLITFRLATPDQLCHNRPFGRQLSTGPFWHVVGKPQVVGIPSLAHVGRLA